MCTGKINADLVEATMSVSVSVVAKGKKALSPYHVRSACYCINNCKRVESQYITGSTWEESAPQYSEDTAYAIGAILSVVAFLEASINELYSDIEEERRYGSSIPPIMQEKIVEEWSYLNTKKDTRKGAKMVRKYNVIANCMSKSDLPDNQVVQDVRAIVTLRNALVHYEPKWQQFEPVSADDPYKVNILQGRFPLNPFMANSGNAFFPDKCLGEGCTRWTLDTAMEFHEYFYRVIGLKSPFDHRKTMSELLV
jgi:hypothetical protein